MTITIVKTLSESCFPKNLNLLQKIVPLFIPWDGTSSADDCVPNPTQVILEQSLYKDTIGPLVEAIMAQQTVAINKCCHVGLKQIGMAVQDMTVYVHEGNEYISHDINLKFHNLC